MNDRSPNIRQAKTNKTHSPSFSSKRQNLQNKTTPDSTQLCPRQNRRLHPSYSSSPFPPSAATAYEALEAYNFPEGILPKGVIGYDLDPATGRFTLYLNSSCSFSLEGSYQLRYKPVVTGVVSQNRLSSLGGVSVKVFFLWLNIVQVERVGDELEFSVGIASAGFGVDNFFESPHCDCGFDCGKVMREERLRLRGGLASSM